jgi:hypothetical protein
MAATASKSKPTHVPLLPRVQGIDHTLDDLVFRSGKFKDKIDRDLLEGKVTRSMGGATHLTLAIDDHDAKVLNSGLLEESFRLQLDGLGFVYVAYEHETGAPLQLTLEAEVAWRLKQLFGPFKAFRDEMTRAEVAKSRVMQLKPPRPRFVSPELHKQQPVKSDREARKKKQESAEERGHGLSNQAKLTCKGEQANQEQLELGDLALRLAESYEAPPVVMIALIAALIAETDMGVTGGNVLGATDVPVGSATEEIIGFLTGKNWTIPGGAIGVANHNPGMGAAEIAQEVQKAGIPTFASWVAESRQWVSEFGGGSISSSRPERFPFAQKKKESNWKFCTELAKPVNWRFFESAGWVYFIAEPDLLASVVRMHVTDSTPGVLNVKVKGDDGKKKDEVEVEALGSTWSAPPGSAVALERHGPADGIYLVDRIEAPLVTQQSIITIHLKRPGKPKKEPAPSTKTVTTKFAGGGSDENANTNAPEAVQRMVEEVDVTNGTFHYQWGGGHESVEALKKRLKGYDCSGYVSHILWAGGLLDEPMSSVPLESFGLPGEGEYCTIYANAEHAFGKLLTQSGWRYFESGGQANATGWVASGQEDPLGGYVARHPQGM